MTSHIRFLLKKLSFIISRKQNSQCDANENNSTTAFFRVTEVIPRPPRKPRDGNRLPLRDQSARLPPFHK